MRGLLRKRGFWAIAAAIPLGVAASLPPEAPGAIFWGCVAVSCLGAAAWGVLDQAES